MPVGSAAMVRRAPQQGFTYVAVLVMLLVISLGTQGVVQVVSQQAQREREEALLNIGVTYARAIGSYYRATPGSIKRWPSSLEDLLEDKRLLQVHRHIRELYPDPMTRMTDWELVPAPQGGIQGIRSRSTRAPLRTGLVEVDEFMLPAAQRYAEWTFAYQPETVPLTSAPQKVRP